MSSHRQHTESPHDAEQPPRGEQAPPSEESAHDVLAAEEFGMPAPDPSLKEPEHAHDVLAAEEFVVPAVDPSLHPRPVELPAEPSGDAEPHDVLAAEEFAVPAGHPPAAPASGAARGGRSPRMALAILTGAAAVLATLGRRRRRSGRR